MRSGPSHLNGRQNVRLRLRAPVANHAVRGTAARHYFSACTVLPDRVEVGYV